MQNEKKVEMQQKSREIFNICKVKIGKIALLTAWQPGDIGINKKQNSIA